MERFRVFRDSFRAMMFAMWCDDHGIRVTGERMFGTGAHEVTYISTDEQEALIPNGFKRA